ncbi:MAG: RING finger protein [Thaumarchaeota archaeon]|nr:RING finger protein [Candidatus Calditenuaceae archaeon]MDW8187335.1 RING finger protein [Nitrososphaerota archaeon]
MLVTGTDVRDALVRLIRVGSLISILGAVHVLTLLLDWVSLLYDNVMAEGVQGYDLPSSFVFSLIAAGLAGASGVLASVSASIKVLRFAVPAFALSGAALAILSPLYSVLYLLPSLQVEFRTEVGAIAALFTGVAMAGGGAISTMIGLVALRPESRPSTYQPYQPMEVEAVQGVAISSPAVSPEEEMFEELLREESEETSSIAARPASAEVQPRLTPPPQIPQAQQPSQRMECVICGDVIQPGSARNCAGCGAPMHRECVETWRDIGGKCPTCGTQLS